MEIRVIRLLVILVVLFGAVIAKASELEERKNFLKNSQKIWMFEVDFICPPDKVKPVISYLTNIKGNGTYTFYLTMGKRSIPFPDSEILSFEYFDWFHGNSAKSMLKNNKEWKIAVWLNENVLKRFGCYFLPMMLPPTLKLIGFEREQEQRREIMSIVPREGILKERDIAFLREYGYRSNPEFIYLVTARFSGNIDEAKKYFKERYGLRVHKHPFDGFNLIVDVKDNVQDAIKTLNVYSKYSLELYSKYKRELKTGSGSTSIKYIFAVLPDPEVFYRVREGEYYRVKVNEIFEKLIEEKDMKKFLTTELYNPQSDREFFIKVKKDLDGTEDFLKYPIFQPEWANELLEKYIPSPFSPFRYSCRLHTINNVTEIDCGPFKIKFSESDYKTFSIEGNFRVQLNRQIAVIANEAGVKVSPYLDLTPAFVKYIVYKAVKYYPTGSINTKKGLINRVILVTYGLTCLINEGDIQLLNRMIKSYVTEKIKNKR